MRSQFFFIEKWKIPIHIYFLVIRTKVLFNRNKIALVTNVRCYFAYIVCGLPFDGYNTEYESERLSLLFSISAT